MDIFARISREQSLPLFTTKKYLFNVFFFLGGGVNTHGHPHNFCVEGIKGVVYFDLQMGASQAG